MLAANTPSNFALTGRALSALVAASALFLATTARADSGTELPQGTKLVVVADTSEAHIQGTSAEGRDAVARVLQSARIEASDVVTLASGADERAKSARERRVPVVAIGSRNVTLSRRIVREKTAEITAKVEIVVMRDGAMLSITRGEARTEQDEGASGQRLVDTERTIVASAAKQALRSPLAWLGN